MDSGRLEAVPNGTVHLDTVRALHQTVVSLRTALEVSKNELKELKEKYERHSHCLDYSDVIEKLTIENHVLRRRIIDADFEDPNPNPNIKLEVTYSPRSQATDRPASGVVIETATEAHSGLSAHQTHSVSETLDPATISDENSKFCSTENLDENPVEEEIISRSPESNATAESGPEATQDTQTADELSQLISQSKEKSQPSYKTKLELLSKFDVRIKVRTLKEGTVVSSSTSDSDSTFGDKDSVGKGDCHGSNATFQFEEKREVFDNKEDFEGNQFNLKAVTTENVTMAVPNEGDAKSKTDKFDVQVRITSEENLVVKENVERSRRRDTLNLDVDDLSLRSMSEGDNSVFSEGVTTPMEPPAEDKQQEGSGNESEEVDDIELIFTTDESKDMSMNLQEDLVSIRETDTWAPNSSSTTHSTPVLIKFHTLDPDFQPSEGKQTPDSLRKRVSLPNDKEIRHVAFDKDKDSLELPGRGILKACDNKSDNMLYKKGPNRLNSVDSLTEYRAMSFDTTKSCSFEMGSSMDILNDQHLGHRFSVFAERDISKCGTSEDDLALSLNIRRNTCPNPFQYRPPPYRGVSRPPGPFKAPLPPSRLRPVLRESGFPRRENAAQTDLSALPNRWSSDGYLAHNQMSLASTVAPPTLPQRMTSRRAPRPLPPPPTRRTDETRRELLSDIGFTSMVPELSRSADPVWALAKKQLSDETITNSTSKFLSRGSSYRSPCASIERSSDWTPHHVYVPPVKSKYYVPVEHRLWRSSLPDVRRDDTDDLLEEAELFLRRSIDNLHTAETAMDNLLVQTGQPYIPEGPKQLRLGHTVKIITPHGRIAVGRVRYVGLAGETAASSSVVIGAEFSLQQHPTLSKNDGTHRGRRYFLTLPQYTALFVPFSKVVMAWAN